MTNELAIKILNESFSRESFLPEKTALIFASENIVNDDIETFLSRSPSDLIREMKAFMFEGMARYSEEVDSEFQEQADDILSKASMTFDCFESYLKMYEKLTEESKSER